MISFFNYVIISSSTQLDFKGKELIKVNEHVYCDSCGLEMVIVYASNCHKYECWSCGNTYTTHDSAYYRREKNGRARHLERIQADIVDCRESLQEAKGKKQTRSIEYWHRQLAKETWELFRFRLEEINRVARLVAIGEFDDDQIMTLSPFDNILVAVKARAIEIKKEIMKT